MTAFERSSRRPLRPMSTGTSPRSSALRAGTCFDPDVKLYSARAAAYRVGWSEATGTGTWGSSRGLSEPMNISAITAAAR